MKQFTCDCMNGQFKKPEEVYVGLGEQFVAEILCAYRPNEKVTLRRIKLEVNYCPFCGSKLVDI